MKIEYKIEEVRPNVFAVIVKDHYHRAMLFCRVQEYYESPNPQFRGKNFSIWDYIEWYSREHRDVFTYTYDWGGFNIPLKTAYDCYEKLREHESPYDTEMETIEWQDYLVFEKNLLDMGYTAAVIPDEIQAYLSTNYEYTKFSKGVSKKKCKALHKEYQKVFDKYL